MDEPLEEVPLGGLGRAPGVFERLVRGEPFAATEEVEPRAVGVRHRGDRTTVRFGRRARGKRERVTLARERTGAFLFGLGAGALVDGFVLHQILQWHHLISRKTSDDTVAGLERNVLADGIFSLAALGVLLAGVALLLGRRLEPRPFVGLALVGWGVFHLVDQGLFHLALGAHHIREGAGSHALYDWGFVALGLAFVAVGATVARRAPEDAPAT